MMTQMQIGLGLQATVQNLQNLTSSGGSKSDIKAATDRMQQFLNTSSLNLQMAGGIADSGSLAQPQIQKLLSDLSDQNTLVTSLTGSSSDSKTLSSLATSSLETTNDAQDGASNALIDCFMPLTALSE